MKKNNNKSRRQFLRNTSLASLALGIPSISAKANFSKSKTEEEHLMCDKTTLDYYGQGPFYTDNPPMIENGILADTNETGDRMIISGRIFNLDCSEYIPNAEVDVWHANHDGEYDNSGYNLRGKTVSNEQGFYVFETIKPGKYLNGSAFRPAHIHFKITAPGYPTLTTQLYFEGDSDLAADAAASITSGTFDAQHRIIPLTENSDNVLEGVWDIVINGEGNTVGVNDIHLDKGIIYKIGPNPFSDSVNIRYGVYRKAKASLLVFDIHGREVATLEERTLTADQYDAVWEPDAGLPDGHYFIALKINDLQVHYLKLIRQKSY